MASFKDNTLKAICTDSNKIRETYYGSTHRAVLTVNGVKDTWDILTIGIPFQPQKEAELMQRFGIQRAQLPEFYAEFEQAVFRHSMLIKLANDTGVDGIQKGILKYSAASSFARINKEGVQTGLDFYFITKPMESFVGSEIISESGAYLKDIISLALRLLQLSKTLNDNGFTLGAVDLDSCYLVLDEDGAEKKYLKTGYTFYGTGPGIYPENYPVDGAAFIAESVASGKEQQNINTDIAMVCRLIWGLLDGKSFRESADTAHAPAYASQELKELLELGLSQGGASWKQLNSGLRAVNKRIAGGETENTYIAFEKPSYLDNPLPELREEEDYDEQASDTNTDVITERKGKNKRKIIGIVGAFLVMLSGAGLILFGPNGILRTSPTVQFSMSGDHGLYSSGEIVVDQDGNAVEEYALDPEGNIVSGENSEEILFPEPYVSEYIYAENIRVEILEKTYSPITETTPVPILRSNVIDLREKEIFFNREAEQNAILTELLEDTKINPDSFFLLRDQGYPDAVVIAVPIEVPDDQEDVDETESQEDLAEIPIRESDALMESLYKAQGAWVNTVKITLEPAECINRKIMLKSLDADHLLFLAEQDGKEMRTGAIRISVKEDGSAVLKIGSSLEGRYLLSLASDDGAFSKNMAMTFERTSDSLIPTPSPAVIPTPTPTPTLAPTPEPTPFPVSTPWPSATPYVEPYQPVYTPAPQPVYTPQPVPEYIPTPEPQIWDDTLSWDYSEIHLSVGETYRLANILNGISGGIGDPFSFSDPTVICWYSSDMNERVSQGYIIQALAAGTCTVTITQNGKSATLQVIVG